MMARKRSSVSPAVSPAASRGAPRAAPLGVRLEQSAVLGAAVEVFARHGFEATRVQDILEAAGIARRTFYKRFANKEEVLAAIYLVATGELLDAIRSAERPGSDPLDAIRRTLDVYLDYHAANARLVNLLVQQAIRDESPLAPYRRRFRDDLVWLIGDAVTASTGEKNDPMFYAALVSALEGISLDLLGAGAGAPEVARAKRVMHLLLDRALPARRAPRKR